MKASFFVKTLMSSDHLNLFFLMVLRKTSLLLFLKIMILDGNNRWWNEKKAAVTLSVLNNMLIPIIKYTHVLLLNHFKLI